MITSTLSPESYHSLQDMGDLACSQRLECCGESRVESGMKRNAISKKYDLNRTFNTLCLRVQIKLRQK